MPFGIVTDSFSNKFSSRDKLDSRTLIVFTKITRDAGH